MIELWRGGVAVSECDGMGHMNVGYYGAKALQGLAGLAFELGLQPGDLQIREQNTRFLREARAGAALYLTGGFLAVDDGGCVAYMRLRHISGEVAAGYRLRLSWPLSAAGRAQALFTPAPDEVMPRGTPDDPLVGEASMARAEALGMARCALFQVGAADCDEAGGLRDDVMMVRISEAIAHLFGGAPPGAPDEEGRLGGVTLEQRQVILRRPRAGDRIEIRSGVAAREGRIRRCVHWLLDVATGEALVRVETLVAAFDLVSRRLAPPDPQPGEPEPLAGLAI
jgi:acyl-CoA thioester hydrolase